MFLRLLFVLLIALNIAVGAWLLLGQDDVHGRSVADAGVPTLHLLSERPLSNDPASSASASAPAMSASVPAPATSIAVAGAGTAPLPAASDAAPPSASSTTPAAVATTPALEKPKDPPRATSYTCMALGPFATPADLRNASNVLTPLTARMRTRHEQITQTSGWWVYLAANGSRDRALELARKLEAAHIGDYFIVSSGDQPNTISLGLFKDPANAHRRRDQVVAAGFPAQLVERSESALEYYLDVVLPDNARSDWRRQLKGVGTRSTGCF